MKHSALRIARVLLPEDLPRGFRFAAAGCGLRKKNRLDVALMTSDAPAAAAAVFTTNLVLGAPVLLCREHMRRAAGHMRAIIVNSGNANCSNGPSGLAASRATAARVAREFGCRPAEVLVCSTGVIGLPMRVDRILKAVPRLVRRQDGYPSSFSAVTRAIMTTDTRPKWAAARCRIGGKLVHLLGCAKGAGMIHPQMATTLAFVLSDATAPHGVLQRALNDVVKRTFNSITVDGDTSTNDTLLVLANGAAGAPPLRAGSADYRKFVTALERVCGELALEVVSDGEGAQRVIEIEVRGAASDRAADQIARTIANSPLVKTALAGADPNWGRILAAAGRAGVRFDPNRVEIRMAGMVVCRRGNAHWFSERATHRRLLERYVPIVVDLKQGAGRARIWTCDFTTDYVHINAHYRT